MIDIPLTNLLLATLIGALTFAGFAFIYFGSRKK